MYDPWVDKDEARREYGIELIDSPSPTSFDAVVLCVAHNEFQKEGIDWISSLGNDPFVLYDVKNILPTQSIDGRL